MDINEFRQYGRQMIDLVANYWESLRKRAPLPDVKPGFINKLVPQDAPVMGEPWEKIFNDINEVVFNCNTHWQHPNFFAYFPTGVSYQSIIGDILSGGIASVGFTWQSSPSMTELEISMTNWLAKVLKLPAEFLNTESGFGVGIIQSTASEATYMAILAARGRTVERIRTIEGVINQEVQVVSDGSGELYHYPYHDAVNITKLVAYCSDQAHSSVEKGVMLAAVRLRKLKTVRGGPFDNFYVTAKVLEEAIMTDRKNDLIPFIFIMTLGTTSSCGVDPVDELGPICQRENIWIHIDSAYAGAFLLCPEYRYLSRGFEYVDSFNMNAHKAMPINFDCSPLWFRNGRQIMKYFAINAVYLKHDQTCAVDYRHFQIALGRRFRSLKVWFVLRNFGITGLQKHLRKMVELAKHFEALIQKDSLFELFVPRNFGLVCFRLKDSTNEMNEELNRRINEDRRIHMVASVIHGVYFLRLAVCSTFTTCEDIRQAHAIIHNFAEDVGKDMKQ
ncbi:aromatic L-amino acid decarboxylase [Loa loa]|uniref:Aromatic-L-amino-acid decarboxylase n=1 Tax=Loa loa TaxID=7209 RepID=A0A1I7VMT0_LOALO|nr:aromatic L-amino acid decarboxylase [Loa loa]EFO23293.2 aromatic L-amino acid decarboxylase [Loa loa]